MHVFERRSRINNLSFPLRKLDKEEKYKPKGSRRNNNYSNRNQRQNNNKENQQNQNCFLKR